MIQEQNKIIASTIIVLDNKEINVYIIKTASSTARWDNRLIVRASFVKDSYTRKDIEIFNLKKQIEELTKMK